MEKDSLGYIVALALPIINEKLIDIDIMVSNNSKNTNQKGVFGTGINQGEVKNQNIHEVTSTSKPLSNRIPRPVPIYNI